MRKYRCPQCDIPSMYVKNAAGERLLVYVYENGEVVPKDPAADLSGFDLTEVFCPDAHGMEHLGNAGDFCISILSEVIGCVNARYSACR